jgi:hypothetical protein
MPITIDGTGSITGLSAGGLPDLSVTTAEIAAGAVTAAKLDGAQSGSAPIYGARAWVNFSGTGTVAIRAAGNVSSITDNGVGNYTVNFTTAMPNANYATVGISGRGATDSRGSCLELHPTTAYTTTTVTVRGITVDTNPGVLDIGTATVAVFS